MIRVLVADDHALVRQGVRALLESVGDVEVVGEAKDGKEAVSLAAELQPDVIIMDISMPNLDGIAATKRVQAANGGTPIIILSMHANQNLVQRALRVGASGYVLKQAITADLLPAVRQALQGNVFLSEALLAD